MVDAEGKSPLAQMLSAIFFGDYVSLYLAIQAGVDPSPTTVIADLKRWLAEKPRTQDVGCPPHLATGPSAPDSSLRLRMTGE